MSTPSTYYVLWSGELYRADETTYGLSHVQASGLTGQVNDIDIDADDQENDRAQRTEQRHPAPLRGEPRATAAIAEPVDDSLNLERNRAACIGLALIRTRGEQKRASALVGVSPRVLNYMIKADGLRPLIDIGRTAVEDEACAVDAFNRFMAGYRRAGAR